MQKFFFVVRVDNRDARFLWKSNQQFLGYVSNLAPISSSISSVSACLQRLLLFLWKCNFSRVWKRHIIKLSTEFTTEFLARTVFIICTIQKQSHVPMTFPLRMLTHCCRLVVSTSLRQHELSRIAVWAKLGRVLTGREPRAWITLACSLVLPPRLVESVSGSHGQNVSVRS
jgi:hypothetical protein